MINAVIESITVVDDELFNRVRAFGSGDGINRMSVTVEDAISVAKYGVRETQIDFPDAVDFEDLEDYAEDFLEAHKEPITEMDITFFFDTNKGPGGQIIEGVALTHSGDEIQYYRFGDERELRRGDTIRIVSQSLGINTTGVIEELDWEPGSVSLSIGRKRYNLIDVINGPDRDNERRTASLGLAVPLGLRAQRAEPGCTVFVNPYVNSRAVGVEIYAGSASDFIPGVASLVARGANTRFDLPQLDPGAQFFFKARSYDDSGNFSDVAGPVAAISGRLPGSKIQGGTIDLDRFVPDARPIVIVDVLPVVEPGNTTYPVGTMVNFLGNLYRLISQTNNVSVDWKPAIGTGAIEDGSITTDKILANTITANNIDAASVRTAVLIADAIKTGMLDADVITAREIQNATITGAKIAGGTITGSNIASATITGSQIVGGTITGTNIANATVDGANLKDLIINNSKLANDAVSADKIQTGAITASKIFVDDQIIISAPGQGAGALTVRNAGGAEVLRLGNITGKSGVPSGSQYGLWGELGTGVYIKGVPRIIKTGIFDIFNYSGGITATLNISRDGEIIAGSFTVPTGKAWVISISVNSIRVFPTGVPFIISKFSFTSSWSPGTVIGNVITPGSYSDLKLLVDIQYVSRSGNAELHNGWDFQASYVIIEYDLP